MNAELKTTVEPFTPREPDWKQLYYNLALRVAAIYHNFQSTDICAQNALMPIEKARATTEQAFNAIWKNEAFIDAGNNIVSVASSYQEEADKP